MKYFVAGGAGFIGSHLVRALLEFEANSVVVFDNLTSGQESYLSSVLDDVRVTFVESDLKDLECVIDAMKGCQCVYHFAANPDIAKAVTEPSIDFWEGTYLLNNILEGSRINQVEYFIYTSGSGVYGDQGETVVDENFGPLLPISTYGASKLACESMLSAYDSMFNISNAIFRFANVVGPRQTHGVVYDFVRRLLKDPTQLSILGDGQQSKSYIHVSDVVKAMMLVESNKLNGTEVFNVATDDYVTVQEIADLVIEHMELSDVSYQFSGGSRGWKGDVPIVRMNSEKIRSLGWKNDYNSKEAIIDSICANLVEAQEELQCK